MLAAFAEAARALDRDDYREAAERNAAFLLHELRIHEGRLLRTWRDRPEGNGRIGEAKLTATWRITATGSRASSSCTRLPIVGNTDSAGTQALLNVVRDGCRSFQVVALGVPSTQPFAVPLLQDRGLVDGKAAAYLCRNAACQAPVTEPEALRVQLKMT
jgi:uncharacterized protein YyaL (SSP411 family)